jgi:hypothetical protein
MFTVPPVAAGALAGALDGALEVLVDGAAALVDGAAALVGALDVVGALELFLLLLQAANNRVALAITGMSLCVLLRPRVRIPTPSVSCCTLKIVDGRHSRKDPKTRNLPTSRTIRVL